MASRPSEPEPQSPKPEGRCSLRARCAGRCRPGTLNRRPAVGRSYRPGGRVQQRGSFTRCMAIHLLSLPQAGDFGAKASCLAVEKEAAGSAARWAWATKTGGSNRPRWSESQLRRPFLLSAPQAEQRVAMPTASGRAACQRWARHDAGNERRRREDPKPCCQAPRGSSTNPSTTRAESPRWTPARGARHGRRRRRLAGFPRSRRMKTLIGFDQAAKRDVQRLRSVTLWNVVGGRATSGCASRIPATVNLFRPHPVGRPWKPRSTTRPRGSSTCRRRRRCPCCSSARSRSCSRWRESWKHVPVAPPPSPTRTTCSADPKGGSGSQSSAC